SGTFGTAQNNLLGNSDGAAAINDGANGNIVGKDPMLGPLQDNGGPTFTQALLDGSPAIDAGINPPGLTQDQRGSPPRDFGGATDIGAYEAGATAPSSDDDPNSPSSDNGRNTPSSNAGTNAPSSPGSSSSSMPKPGMSVGTGMTGPGQPGTDTLHNAITVRI